MRFFHAAASLALGLAATVKADYTAVTAAISQLNDALAVLDADIKLVRGGSLGVASALQVEVDAVSIHKVILSGTDAATKSTNFGLASPAVSLSVINLSPNVTRTLKDLQGKVDAFGGLSPIVLSSLYQLKQDTDNFGKAVIAKLEPLEAGIAPAIVKGFDDAFNSAITTYGGKAT